jgi:TRAP-type mannitol/chloroaromatic compound transport system substrate-binding protein
MKLSRKTFFKGLAITTLSLPLAIRGLMDRPRAQDQSPGSRTHFSGPTYNWKMVTTWPPNFKILGEACELFAQRVEKMSGGRMQIQVYGGGELVPALEVFDTVRFGGAEIGNGASYYWAGKAPATQFFASVPFGMNAQQLNAWFLGGGGLELWEELYAQFNLLPLPGGNTGVQMGGWFNREINGLEDLRGLKMRIPGLGGKVLEKAGGAPVLLAGGEIYTGLERGVIDATEWLGPFHDNLMGFPEIARYYYSPGWHECGTALEYIFNKEKFEALPEDLQQILRSAALEMNGWVLARFEAENALQLEKMIDRGVDLRSFPPEVIRQLRLYTEEVLEEITQRDPFSRKVYESYRAFQKRMTAYARITEQTYYNQIQLS